MLNNLVEIGARIREKREELGYKQQGFAEKIKIDKSSLNRYENGKQTPSLETMVQIADGLNSSLDYLIYGTGTECVEKVSQHKTTYAYKVLRAIITLVEEGFINIVDIPRIDCIAFNIKKNLQVLDFFEEVINFCKCRDRIDEKAYEKGLDAIIKEYENAVLHFDYNVIEAEDYEGSDVERYVDKKYNEKMEEIKKNNKK